ncbi:hypothetical protein [Pseudomonas oryziphila]|uniref:Uncharacterized protein n=1 Tax=Pseudomonas entomophila TaxID=312306 RepID=A0A3Q8U1B0_9PSED|nr:hypothetical protein [Pseudomonas oryziphila]AZL68332.1 hypothetical protein EJA05_11620 [Pseudomonas oryziphila]
MELFDLIDIFLRDGSVEKSELLGVSDFYPEALKNAGYYLVGEVNDFHSYENYIDIFHKKRSLWMLHKQYFNKKLPIGNAFEIGPRVRMATLIKHLPASRGLRFFFDEARKEGAMTIDDYYVVRFNESCSRGAYFIEALESSLDKSGEYEYLAIRMVVSTLTESDLNSPLSRKDLPKCYKKLKMAVRKRSRTTQKMEHQKSR